MMGSVAMTEQAIKTETISVNGMTCVSCKNRIEKKLLGMKGISEAEVSYVHGTAKVTYDRSIVDLDQISEAIEALDYEVSRPTNSGVHSDAKKERDNLIGVLLIVFALFLFLNQGGGDGVLTSVFNFFPQAEKGMGYGMLFIVGLLTSIHCVAMCGGINMSQCLGGCAEQNCGGKSSGLLSYSSLRPTILYNSGRVISYTTVGGIVGALGSVVSFSGAAKGIVQLIAGIFMVIIGINMLGMFKSLRRLAPTMPKFLTRRIENSKNGKGPLYVGLLNCLMPCGPLQAMQLFALYTGSPFKGALSMLVFSLGTVPLMFGLGAFSSLMSKKFTGRVMRVGASLVIVLGVVMFNNGMALSDINFPSSFGGSGNPLADAPEGATAAVSASGEVQEITTAMPRYGYPSFTVKAGIPVRWNLRAEKGTINGCNNAIVMRSFKVEKRLQVGDNIIEFTPTKAGKYRYSCWMGMIRGSITVVDGDLPEKAESLPAAEAAEIYEDEGTAFAGGCCSVSFNSDSYEEQYDDEDSFISTGGGCCSPGNSQ
jgi:sulfite exporter TauE/SafE/copper chaperone CopZ